ncbi:hypothetical protein CEXT_252321, partial [Caerostris extrusa]
FFPKRGGPRAAAGCRRAAPPSGVSRAGTDCEGRKARFSIYREGKRIYAAHKKKEKINIRSRQRGGGRSVFCTVGMVGKVHETGMSGEEL